jgi:hypothetical protein
MGNENGGTAERIINDPPERELVVLAIRRATLDLLTAPIRANPTPSNGCLQQQGFG